VTDSSSIYALPRNLVLAASAGTGKTHALVGVVAHLLVVDRGGRGRAQPLDPSRIVATTFSRKAAAEIRARVTQELERLSNAPDTSPYIASLRLESELADSAIALRARRALGRLTQARFGTLHSFATGIVRAYAVELGIGPRFELSTEADARARAEDAIARALEVRLEAQPGMIRSLADAAGGIDMLVLQLRRILVQLEEDGRAARDLAVPEGDVAALEVLVGDFIAHARDLTAVPRFEVAAREVLATWDARDEERLEPAMAALAAIAATGKKVPEVEAFAVFRKELVGTTNDEKGRRLARAFRSRASFAEHGRLVRDVLADAEAEIERLGRSRASLGFGEILRAARELLRDRPDVADEVAAGIDALLVDEFQDTSRVQRDLIQLLWARPGTRTAGAIPRLADIRATGLPWCRRRRLRGARRRARRFAGARGTWHPSRRHLGAA
jgi:ATP-dependent helicase/nuclease subunit A